MKQNGSQYKKYCDSRLKIVEQFWNYCNNIHIMNMTNTRETDVIHHKYCQNKKTTHFTRGKVRPCGGWGIPANPMKHFTFTQTIHTNISIKHITQTYDAIIAHAHTHTNAHKHANQSHKNKPAANTLLTVTKSPLSTGNQLHAHCYSEGPLSCLI